MPMAMARSSRKSDALHATLALVLALTNDASGSLDIRRVVMYDGNRDLQPPISHIISDSITVPHLTGIFVSHDSVTAARSLAG